MSHTTGTFFGRHEFLIRRLHSLSGLVPVGAYMTVHLLVNSSLVRGAGAFQNNVNQIHSLGPFLPLVEWAFIFLPIIFHAAFGVWIIMSGKSNVDRYRYTSNFRYAMQRWTGVIAIVFIFFHVFHLHGWFHGDYWLKIVEPWGMASFRPYNAASTLATALSGFLWPIFYLLGVLACVYHFANGVWTAGITWGIWISPKAQRWATYLCTAGGIGLAMVGLTALYAATQIDIAEAKRVEDNIDNARVTIDSNEANDHKRSHPSESSEGDAKSKDDAAK
jgi:succinate dehydrogenase / fumarate reductase, cytochrome b subunit